MSGVLAGRSAVVTGGASGIGAAIARQLSDAGAEVVVADRDPIGAQEVADQIGGTSWVVDLTDLDALAGVSLDCDILVNNAGFQHVSPVESFAWDTFHSMIGLMLEAPFLLMRAAIPHMAEQGFGRIINITSVHGIRASAYKSAYVAAKHGLEGLSKVAALEGGGRGITSTCVSPGYVRTPLVDQQIADQARAHDLPESEVVEKVFFSESAVKRFVEPSEVAELVVWLAGPSAGMANGSTYTLDGGWSAR